jgi:hypothetical protein
MAASEAVRAQSPTTTFTLRRALGLALSLSPRNFLILFAQRIDHSVVLSFWNVAELEASQKAPGLCLLAGPQQLLYLLQ